MKKQIGIRAWVGLGFGLGFTVVQVVVLWTAEEFFGGPVLRSVEQTFGILDVPAEWLGYIWQGVLHLPPHSELAWLLVPFVTISIQWGLIGFLAGLCWGIMSPSDGEEGKRIGPFVLIGGGALAVCGLLVLVLGIVFPRTMDPDYFKVPSKPNVPANEQDSPYTHFIQTHKVAKLTPEQIEEVVRKKKAMEIPITQEDIEIDEALEANPNDAELHYRQGVRLVERDMVFAAMFHFERALELRPNYAEAHYHLGLALISNDEVNKAIKHFRKALEIKPDFAEAKKHLEEAIKKKGN